MTDCPTGLSSDRPRYHHGALQTALLSAAEAELAESGLEAFSLRRVAKRAGVSHAAPAHHFGDVNGLLTALAAQGFGHFVAAMEAREAAAAPDPRARMVAAGLGYVDFALARPALFRLMFASSRPDYATADLGAEAQRAYRHLTGLVAGMTGRTDPVDVMAVWGMAHGLADLLSAGRMGELAALGVDARHRAIAAIMDRAIPAG